MEPLAIVFAIVAALAIAGAAFYLGRSTSQRGERDTSTHPRLDEYDFYPFTVAENGQVAFDPPAFESAVEHLLANRNPRAAGELIIIGEQNLVRETFTTRPLQRYKALFDEYDGDSVINENSQFLENYRRIVSHLGRSFPNTGIEILLHNLVNPSHSLVEIENGEVTGRSIGSGATNLVLDLKTRRNKGEDKINYELNIGGRQFKCTTVPIFRRDYGLVGALCINIDTHFIREYVRHDERRLDAFIDNLLRTDFELDEMILSSDEYANALNGKRHFLDEAIRTASAASQTRRLAAILFSDIVGFTSLMGRDEQATLAIMATNDQIHDEVLTAHGGRLLKKLGDGILASFDSVSAAVDTAKQIQERVGFDGRYQVRIGIHLGEVIETDGDVHGDGVNIASRILNEIDPGSIGMSAVVYQNIRNKPGIEATLVGERQLKNVEEPVVLYTLGA